MGAQMLSNTNWYIMGAQMLSNTNGTVSMPRQTISFQIF